MSTGSKRATIATAPQTGSDLFETTQLVSSGEPYGDGTSDTQPRGR